VRNSLTEHRRLFSFLSRPMKRSDESDRRTALLHFSMAASEHSDAAISVSLQSLFAPLRENQVQFQSYDEKAVEVPAYHTVSPRASFLQLAQVPHQFASESLKKCYTRWKTVDYRWLDPIDARNRQPTAVWLRLIVFQDTG